MRQSIERAPRVRDDLLLLKRVGNVGDRRAIGHEWARNVCEKWKNSGGVIPEFRRLPKISGKALSCDLMNRMRIVDDPSYWKRLKEMPSALPVKRSNAVKREPTESDNEIYRSTT